MLAYPSVWLKHLDALVGSVTLDVAGYTTSITIKADDLKHIYFPLLALLDEHTHEKRVLAGLAGVPGSGKSTLAGILSHVADHVLGPGRLAIVGIDGWHYPNAILDQRMITDETGQLVPLRQRKGGPASFDIPALTQALHRLKGMDKPVRLSCYDRKKHDPVPDGMTIEPKTRIVLVEGNYLLSNTVPWSAVRLLLAPTFFLACESTLAHGRVLARHIRGGCTPAQADAKYNTNDRLNTEIVQATASYADFIIQLDPYPGIKRVCRDD